MSEPKRVRPSSVALASLVLVMLAGAAAAVFAGPELARAATTRERLLPAVALLAGVASAIGAARWLRLLLAPGLRRTFAGSRLPSAYFAWALWTALFLFLSWKAGVRFGPGAGLALAAVTLHFGARHLDLLPRLVLLDDALIGPFLPRTPLEALDACELRDVPGRQLLCLRLLVRGDDAPMTEWLAPNQRPALERVLAARRVTPRAFPPVAPPVL